MSCHLSVSTTPIVPRGFHIVNHYCLRITTLLKQTLYYMYVEYKEHIIVDTIVQSFGVPKYIISYIHAPCLQHLSPWQRNVWLAMYANAMEIWQRVSQVLYAWECSSTQLQAHVKRWHFVNICCQNDSMKNIQIPGVWCRICQATTSDWEQCASVQIRWIRAL